MTSLKQQVKQLQLEVAALKELYLSPADRRFLDELYVIRHCAKHFDLTSSALVGRCRVSRIVSARRVSIKCVDRYTVLNYFKMGELFNGRDYDTIRREVVALDLTVNEAKHYDYLCIHFDGIAKSAGLTVEQIDKAALKQFLTTTHNGDEKTYIVT